MPPIPPSSPHSSGSHVDEKRTDMESEATDNKSTENGNGQNVERRGDAEDTQEDPTEDMEEPEHGEVVQNREVVDLMSDDSRFDDVPLGELSAALRQTDSENIVKKEQADDDGNYPKHSSNIQETIENDKESSMPGAESHETGISAHAEIDAEEASDDRGTDDTSTVIETEVASGPMNENEDKEDRSKPMSDGSSTCPPNLAKGYPCPPGKRPTGKKWDRRRGIFVPTTSTSTTRPVNLKESRRPSPSNRKKNADGLYPCPIGGRRITGMRWDGQVGAFVPRSRFRTNYLATRDSSKGHDGKEDHAVGDSKDKPSRKKRHASSLAEKYTKRPKLDHASLSSAPATAPRKPREPGTEIASRVYACYPGNNLWYWGIIVDIKRKKNSHFDQYSVLFDDGDFVEYLSRNKYLTRFQYREKPPSFPTATATELRRLLGSKADDILSSSPPIGGSTMTLEQLLLSACGQCTNCRKPDCKQCAGCISSRPQVCIQKMCCKIPIEKKAQPVPISASFPKGWKFVMLDPKMPGYDRKAKGKEAKKLGIQGLKLLPPTGNLSYYSVERARGQNPTVLAKVSPEAFYQHIGAMCKPLAYTSGKSNTRGKRACGCENCARNACGKCARCKSGSIPCLQKMCLNVKPTCIAEPAVGFPEGYCFFFKKKDTDRSPRVMILSRGGREYTLEGALMHCSLNDPDDVSRKFNEFVGLLSNEKSPRTQHQGSARRQRYVPRNLALLRKGVDVQDENEGSESNDDEFTHASHGQAHSRSPLEPRESRFGTDDFLIGRKYSFAWTDLKGQKKVVYGKVTECEIESESEDVISYKVEYNDKSRTLANALHNGCGSAVPEFQWLEPQMAIGGCVGYDEHTSTSANRLIEMNLPFHTTWITPDARHEAVGNGLPQLTLAVRGYEITFKVKQSTIANAGNGVFLSCSQMFDDDDNDEQQSPFELKCGELLDIGSYAPLRIGDRRSEPVMYVKCFIHSAKCEEFAFDQKGSTDQLDITDDITGMLHAKAKKSIHAYVNESNEKDDICIWAEHDAEDSIHYLLGNANKAQGTFRLPCDGREQEVFINYGPHYEKVRVRKGYSFLSKDEQADILEELQDEDMKDVLEMSSFCEIEVEKATNFLFLLFTEEPRSKFTDPVMVERSLLCTAILQRRARYLFVDKDDDATTCQDSLKSVCRMLRKLVFILLGMLNDERDELYKLQAGGDFDGLVKKILERQYSEEQLSKLGDFLQLEA